MAEGRPRTLKADETPVPGFKYYYKPLFSGSGVS